MTSLPAQSWPILLPEIQYTINTTFQRSVGCAPYLIMFGTTPPSQAPFLPEQPSKDQLQEYAKTVKSRVHAIQKATAVTHTHYRSKGSTPLGPDEVT